ncbi:MAG: class I SAM-dependent methyltransferase, partial [Candidatus Acidiferrales bacterium]
MTFKDRILRRAFNKLYRHRLADMLQPEFPILLDYPVDSRPRYGYGKPSHPQLLTLLDSGRERYAERLHRFCSLREWLCKIPVEPNGLCTPHWNQAWFTTLDAVSLYGMLCEFRPKRLIEVGSGYSTKFARRAISDHGFGTHITSMDPAPRAEIDEICDSVIRTSLEHADLRIFEKLEPGDFLFIDSSHRVFQNSDVMIAFLELLPRLKPGIIFHFHDIFWPRDYLPEWSGRYYSEQYLLGTYLLGDAGSKIEILMPNAFVCQDEKLAEVCKPLT